MGTPLKVDGEVTRCGILPRVLAPSYTLCADGSQLWKVFNVICVAGSPFRALLELAREVSD